MGLVKSGTKEYESVGGDKESRVWERTETTEYYGYPYCDKCGSFKVKVRSKRPGCLLFLKPLPTAVE